MNKNQTKQHHSNDKYDTEKLDDKLKRKRDVYVASMGGCFLKYSDKYSEDEPYQYLFNINIIGI
ncbi:MAG: hypothetical protein MI975_23715 [Cytophagales bacterium]|nr:hypothetical protein [Cytophagales bacterium]